LAFVRANFSSTDNLSAIPPIRKVAQDVIKKTIIEQAKNLAASNEAVNHLADKKVAARELREEFQKNKGQVSVAPLSWRECRCACSILNSSMLNVITSVAIVECS
jgi:hypothetical protein